MITKIRKSLGWTQEELARRSGISRVSINRYERNERVPDLLAAKAIAEAMGCRIEDILDDSDDAQDAVV